MNECTNRSVVSSSHKINVHLCSSILLDLTLYSCSLLSASLAWNVIIHIIIELLKCNKCNNSFIIKISKERQEKDWL